MESNKHVSVLLHETIDALNIKPTGIYVDATLGRGGHAKQILERLGPTGLLIGIDRDHEAIKYCQNLFKDDRRVILVESNFTNLEFILHNLKIDYVDGILMDLGVSSPQLDNADRGFSYVEDGPLDMRMDQSQKITAEAIVNNWSAEQLTKMFRRYGEVPNPSRVVKSIIAYRSLNPIKTTGTLVDIIRSALSPKELIKKHGHPEKVYFQALRIETNDELNNLQASVTRSAALLKKDGILAIISFHSLEDKIVQQAFRILSQNHLPKEIPINEVWRDFEVLKPSGVKPTATEVFNNSRAASAKLRILKRIKLN